MPSDVLDDAAVAKHQEKIEAENNLRQGMMTPSEVMSQFSHAEAKEIIRNSKQTKLQALFERLPLSDALDVWNLATPSERDTLHTLLWKKRLAYLKNTKPSQRYREPVFQKMQNVYGDLQ